MVRLSAVSSDYIVVLLPLITRQLHIENDSSRLEVVNCLSQIFSNADSDLITQFFYLILPDLVETPFLSANTSIASKIAPRKSESPWPMYFRFVCLILARRREISA